MATLSRMSSVKEAVAQCPICTEIYDDKTRIPRRLPCCGQLTCQLCLQAYSKGRRTIPCPMCRENFTMSDGVKSLAKDLTVLRFLDACNQTIPKCTDCPDRSRSIAKCSDCGVYLCRPCCDAHRRHSVTRSHRISDLEHAQVSEEPQQPVINQRRRIPNEVAEKLEIIKTKIRNLAVAGDNIRVSKTVAIDTINNSFDDLGAEIQERRSSLLELVDFLADKEEKNIMIAVESNRGLQERIEQSIEDRSSFKEANLSLDSADDIQYVRRGVNFIDNDMKEIAALVKSVGCVRTITYNPREWLKHLEGSSPCTAISIDYTKRDLQ